jgi:TolB-like protein/ankyrin repeat protein
MIAIGVAYLNKPTTATKELVSIERIAFPLPDKPSIAVLPFTNMSDDAQQEYFADGMTEDLITDISKVPGLFVIARNSVFTYKGKSVKVRQVAEELGVRYVLEGSVRRVRDQVRINAQLIDATTGGHLWADRYDGSMSDVFSLQDKITRQIVTALTINLTGSGTTKQPTTSTRAYDLFLQGWAHYQRHSENDSVKAIPLFEAALELDSNYVQAHAALAAVYWEIWENEWAGALNMTLTETMHNAKVHLALAMKEPSSLAHWVASNILISEGDYQTAAAEAEQIVALDSNNADGYATLANALILAGKPNESAGLIDKAVRLDPYHSPLHAAAKIGDSATVKKLIADGVSIATKDYYGKTALHVAAENGHENVAALLIDAGADIEAITPQSTRGFRDFGSSPLLITAHLGHTDVARLLINSGADVNFRTRGFWQWTVLHFAASNGHADIVELLIANGADINSTATGNLKTPLFEAARGKHQSTVALLINKGANVNSTDSNASTPLHLAVISGNSEIASLLLANGAKVNAKTTRGDYAGETPLHATAYSGQMQVTELLLASGADIDATDQNGYTPLRRAVDEGQLALVELLIKKGADIATRDKYGMTPLHVVARTDQIALAELLISSGADINNKDKNLKFTPLDYAQDGEPKMIELLEQHGAICTIC